MHDGVRYVGVRADKWEDVVAKRIVSNQLNRERVMQAIQLHGKVEAAQATESILRKNLADERALKKEAKDERDAFATENATLTRKKKNRNKAIVILLGAVVTEGGLIYLLTR